MEQRRVLFLCTGNSCRSQMAEGWVRHLLPGIFHAESAGISPHGVNTTAIEVMAEAGVDISGHRSSDVAEFDLETFDVVVTVCDNAQERCPVVPAPVRVVHQAFDDPPAVDGTDEEVLDVYRRVRDEIAAFVKRLPEI